MVFKESTSEIHSSIFICMNNAYYGAYSITPLISDSSRSQESTIIISLIHKDEVQLKYHYESNINSMNIR